MFLFIYRFGFIGLFLFPAVSYALPSLGTSLQNPVRVGSVQEFIAKVLSIVVEIGIPIAILFIIYAGFLFVTAQGNETKLNKAKSAFLWAVIGAAVLIGAELLARAIEGTINQI